MALIGYARVSTGDQSLALQRDALQQAGCLDIYEEQASGARQDRPVLTQALRSCRQEDVLVVWRLDRLGRDTRHLLALVETLKQRGIGLKTLTGFEIDTTTSQGMLMLTVFAGLAEYERALLRERTMAGLASARARGRKGGRKPRLSAEQQTLARQMHQGGTTVVTIARHLGCDRKTVYKALATTN